MGMTETSGLITYTDIGASVENLNKTVGKVAPEFEMKIVDKIGKKFPTVLPGK